MMDADALQGYQSSFAVLTNTPHQAWAQRRHGYTEPDISVRQHVAVVLATSISCAFWAYPVQQLQSFYFLSDLPGKLRGGVQAEKRAHFARVMREARWCSGRASVHTAVEYTVCLGTYLYARSLLPPSCDVSRGFAAGAAAGVAYTALRHPYDVLCATAQTTTSGHTWRGPWSVLRAVVRERPGLLFELYKGAANVALARGLRFGVQFGVYNGLRYDGVYRGVPVLFFYCYLGSVLGLLLEYPVVVARRQLRARNLRLRGPPLSYRGLLSEIRRRHGLTKLYDGFFVSRPMLRAITPALLMTLYDVCARFITEREHPECIVCASPSQALTNLRRYEKATQPTPPYEFGHS